MIIFILEMKNMFWEDENSFSLGPFIESCKTERLGRWKWDRTSFSL